jgi:hypothetical protein
VPSIGRHGSGAGPAIDQRGAPVRKPVSIVLGVALLIASLLAVVSSAGASGSRSNDEAGVESGYHFWQTHGYLPVDGVASYYRQKAAAAAWAAGRPQAPPPRASRASATGTAPIIGASWQGQNGGTPPDGNGAIGPNSYIEDLNLEVAIYNRTGGLITAATFATLTGHGGESDPMFLWDPRSQRFYYNILNVGNATMDWGFSKDDNPTTIPGSFCNYETSFGYQVGSIPDYPKLGQTIGFLMIGLNFYPSFSNQHATEADLLWISKPPGRGPITTCPASTTFKSGKFADLRNQDGTQAFTPVPAIQTDPNKVGWVTAMSDIECPDICGNGNQLTVFAMRPSPSDPTVPILSPPHSITVATFTSPPDAPQKGTTSLVDTLDGRLMHSVSGFDPTVGTTTVWVNHTVLGGAGAETRWYEINPLPLSHPTIAQSGVATDPLLYAYDGGVSNDRTVTATGAAHGDSMIMGFSTSSSTTYPTVQMVSKIGAGAQSAFVLVHASTTFTSSSRWGDYSGATPDPAASLTAAHGEVWLTDQYVSPFNGTWNWEASP